MRMLMVILFFILLGLVISKPFATIDEVRAARPVQTAKDLPTCLRFMNMPCPDGHDQKVK